MKKQTKDQILQSLEKARKDFDKAVISIGDKVRLEVIIPVCKRHNLEFLAGMGTFFFSTQNGKTYGEDFEVFGQMYEWKKVQITKDPSDPHNYRKLVKLI